MNIIERPEARSQGLTRYYTGRPCKHGHLSERFVSTGSCIECCTKVYNHRGYAGKASRYLPNEQSEINDRNRLIEVITPFRELINSHLKLDGCIVERLKSILFDSEDEAGIVLEVGELPEKSDYQMAVEALDAKLEAGIINSEKYDEIVDSGYLEGFDGYVKPEGNLMFICKEKLHGS